MTKKIAFVTGATGGVGRLIADRLLRSGWRVLGATRDPVGAPLPAAIETIALDLSDDDAIARAGARVTALAGEKGLSALINCAGVIVDGPLELIPVAEFRRSLDINVVAPFALTRALAPSLRRARGRVVNIGAVSAYTTPPFYGAIASSKAALASLSDAMRLELGGFGVQVMLIEPGALRTGIFETAARAQAEAMRCQPEPIVALYRDAIDAVHRAFEKFGADDPRVVVNAVMRALSDRRPKPRMVVGKGAPMMATLRVLPDRTRDGLLLNMLGVAKAMKPARAGV
jgi:NAD(P)-dependent dehydrogenase (short-subunit alcohol dehydrogenase family)